MIRLFADRGWVVTVAKAVAEATDSFNPPPHCILLALTLPDGEGEDAVPTVREEDLPTNVAVCDGTSDPVRLARVKGVDPAVLFEKPIDFEALCELVEAKTGCPD